jgi:N-formylglutamate amidohydrolase
VKKYFNIIAKPFLETLNKTKILKNKIIRHIPHSSTNIPLTEGFVVDEKYLANEMLKLTDWCTDDLFYSVDDEMVKAEFSRIFCDPERFTDDAQEGNVAIWDGCAE